MPRTTLLRIVSLPILVYLICIIIWIVLPSFPSVHNGNYSHYHQDVLRSGDKLTTEYSNYQYTSQDGVSSLHADCFSVDWQLISNVEHNSIELRVGKNTTIDLTQLANVATPYTDLATSGAVSITAKKGTLDGVMLPWFDEADQCLLNWEITHEEHQIDIRAIASESGVVQIWPESTYWSRPLQIPPYNSSLEPLLTMSNIPVSGNMANVGQVEISHMTWRVPSRTYLIRWALLKALKPVTLSASEFWGTCIAPALDYVGTIIVWLGQCVLYLIMFAVMAIGCWSAASRPPNRLPFKQWLRQRFWLTKWLYRQPVEGWLRQFWITRWLYSRSRLRVIKGPGGVITQLEDEEEDELDYEHQHSDPRPSSAASELRTLSSPSDFFRSRAPLDDLLNTFESTRWMTAPIGRARTLRRGRFVDSEDKADVGSNV